MMGAYCRYLDLRLACRKVHPIVCFLNILFSKKSCGSCLRIEYPKITWNLSCSNFLEGWTHRWCVLHVSLDSLFTEFVSPSVCLCFLKGHVLLM